MNQIDRRNILKLMGATATLGMIGPAFAERLEENFSPHRKVVL